MSAKTPKLAISARPIQRLALLAPLRERSGWKMAVESQKQATTMPASNDVPEILGVWVTTSCIMFVKKAYPMNVGTATSPNSGSPRQSRGGLGSIAGAATRVAVSAVVGPGL